MFRRSSPLRLHWSIPFGALVFTGLQLEPALWLGFLGLMAVHVAGHLLAAKAVGGRVVQVVLSGLGGTVRCEGQPALARAAVAAGGVGGQLLLLGAALVFGAAWPPQVLWLATVVNAWLAAINLIPIAPFDGAEAWRFPWLLGVALREKLSNFRDVRHLEDEDPEEFAMNHTKKGAEAKELAESLLAAARAPEKQEHGP